MIRYLDLKDGNNVVPYSILLDGTNEYISKTSLSTSLSGNFSASGWFKSNTITADSHLMQLSDGTNTAEVLIRNSDKYFCLSINGTIQATSSTNYNDGVAHNVVMTRSGNVITVYVDSVSKVSYDLGLVRTYTAFYAGGRSAGTNCWKGYIDEFNIWTRLLTAGELTDLYNSGEGIYYHASDSFPSSSTSLSNNILLAWHLDEGTGTGAIITDATGNGNTGTTNNIETGDWTSTSTNILVVPGRTWNTAMKMFQFFNNGKLIQAGDTVHVAKTDDPVAITTDGSTPVTGVFTADPNGVAHGNTAIPKTITGATNASPIVITCAGHGMVDGDWICMQNVNGNTSANGMWRVANKTADTFELYGSKGNGARTSGGTFYDVNSRVIPLSSSISKSLPRMCRGFWQLGTGITMTDSPHMKSGRALTGTINVAGTQKIMWVDLGGTFDFSAYQFVNWDMYMQTAITANKLQLVFCSDTAGNTPIVGGTINHPGTDTSTTWVKTAIDNGSALPSGVKSIAIYSNGAVNTGVSYFDTIWLSKASTAYDHINSFSLFGVSNAVGTKFYGIDQIVDDTILIANAPTVWLTSTPVCWGWYGTSNTYNLYRRETLKFAMKAQWTDYPGYMTYSATEANPITWKGGYNKTNDTQDGETWVSSTVGNRGIFLYHNANHNYAERMHGAWMSIGSSLNTITNNKVNAYFTACSSGIAWQNAVNGTVIADTPNCGQGMNLTGDNYTIEARDGVEIDITNCYSGQASFYAVIRGSICKHKINASFALTNPGFALGNLTANCKFKDIDVKYCSNMGFYIASVCNTIDFGAVDSSYGFWGSITNGNGYCATINYSSYLRFKSLTATNIGGYLSYGNYGVAFNGCTDVYILGGSTNGGYYSGFYVLGSVIYLRNYTIDNTLPVRYASATNDGSLIFSENDGGVVGTNKIYSIAGLITYATDQRHTAIGTSLKVSPTSTYASVTSPIQIKLGLFPVIGDVSNTLYAWMRRDNTGINGTIIIKSGEDTILTADLSDSITEVADTWEKLELTFTPNETGMVQMYLQVYGGTSYNLWVDDINGDTQDRQYFAQPYYSLSGGGESSYAFVS